MGEAKALLRYAVKPGGGQEMTQKQGTDRAKPKVVFDPKMPRFEYRYSDGTSLSVDRKRGASAKPPADCLANIRIA